jgi:hypothetical protein
MGPCFVIANIVLWVSEVSPMALKTVPLIPTPAF